MKDGAVQRLGWAGARRGARATRAGAHAALAAALSLAALLTAGSKASAQTQPMRPVVIELFDAGRKLAGAGDYAGACAKFEEAIHADGTRRYGLLMNLGQCNEKQGRTATAWSLYKEAAFTARREARVADEANATQLAADLEPKLPRLLVNATANQATSGLVIRTDGQELGAGMLGTAIPLDPGSHIVEVTAPGYSVWSTTVTVEADGSVKTLNVPALVKQPPLAPGATAAETKDSVSKGSTWRTAGFVLLGGGAAGLVLGGVTGGLAIGDHGGLGACVNGHCPESLASKVNAYGTMATVSTVGFLAGGVAAGIGLGVLIATSPKSGAHVDVTLMVGPGHLGAVGRF
jgi:hypothetical protein